MLCVIQSGYAQAPQATSVGLKVGYRRFPINNHIVFHNGGSVSVGGQQDYLAAGINFQTPISQRFTFDAEADLLFGGEKIGDTTVTKHHHKKNVSILHVNTRSGLWAAVGTSYYVTPSFYVGVEAGAAGILLGSRLEETGKKEVEHDKLVWEPLGGIKAGVHFTPNSSFELAAHGGEHGAGLSAMLAIRF